MSTQSNRRQNISLIIGLSIPVAMILFVAIAINGPRWFNTIEAPKHDFIYLSGQPNPYFTYVVQDGRVTLKEGTVAEGSSKPAENPVHFFIHDVSENTNREIPEEEALSLQVDGSVRSADGFTLESGRRGGWFLFGYSRDYRSRYLVKENYSQKLNLETQGSNYNYYWNIQFLGWLSTNE